MGGCLFRSSNRRRENFRNGANNNQRRIWDERTQRWINPMEAEEEEYYYYYDDEKELNGQPNNQQQPKQAADEDEYYYYVDENGNEIPNPNNALNTNKNQSSPPRPEFNTNKNQSPYPGLNTNKNQCQPQFNPPQKNQPAAGFNHQANNPELHQQQQQQQMMNPNQHQQQMVNQKQQQQHMQNQQQQQPGSTGQLNHQRTNPAQFMNTGQPNHQLTNPAQFMNNLNSGTTGNDQLPMPSLQHMKHLRTNQASHPPSAAFGQKQKLEKFIPNSQQAHCLLDLNVEELRTQWTESFKGLKVTVKDAYREVGSFIKDGVRKRGKTGMPIQEQQVEQLTQITTLEIKETNFKHFNDFWSKQFTEEKIFLAVALHPSGTNHVPELLARIQNFQTITTKCSMNLKVLH